MRIGIDFDNTIVCYDEVFYRLALEQGLIPPDVTATKQAVRDALRAKGRERDWIELQGEVYGARMNEAKPFDGIFEFLERCHIEHRRYFILSHKTQRPVAGQSYDLHEAARSWLSSHGVASKSVDGVYFEEKRTDKLSRIEKLGCTHFIDDLPEFLTERDFPLGVERLLFDPKLSAPANPKYRRMTSWSEFELYLFNHTARTVDAEVDVSEIATHLLAKAGLAPLDNLTRMTGGVNNRVFKVNTPDGAYALKIYFSHPSDPRDRLGIETTFTNHARSLGLDCLAELVAFDRQMNAALYSFAEGRRFGIDDVTQSAIDQAARFVLALNQDKVLARDLRIASEASFSIHGHIDTIDKRVALLQENVRDESVRSFVTDEIKPAWEVIRSTAVSSAGDRYFEELSEDNQCLSPSDFGFHNAVLGIDGKVQFVDFEYAGWDDPAHLLCDFFCQISVPVSDKYRPFMMSKLGSLVSDPNWFRRRVDILTPVYQIKWCCILLNDFLQIEGKRRAFAGLADDRIRHQRQLHQSRQLLAHILESSQAVAGQAD